MEAQAIGLTGDSLLFLGPKSEAVAHAPNLKCVVSGQAASRLMLFAWVHAWPCSDEATGIVISAPA